MGLPWGFLPPCHSGVTTHLVLCRGFGLCSQGVLKGWVEGSPLGQV